MEMESGKAKEIFVFGIFVFNLGRDFIELGLVEFDDGTRAIGVTSLGKIEGTFRVFEQVITDAKAIVGIARVEPGNADIANRVIFRVAHCFIRGFRAKFSFFLAR